MAVPGGLARMIANPATRAQVPTSMLPARYQAMRAANARRAQANASPLYNPLAVLSGGDLKNAVTTEVNAALNPAEDLLRREGGAQSRRMGDYFKQIAPQFQQAAQASTDAAAQLARQLAVSGQQSQQAITGDEAQANALMQQDQGVRGGGLDAGYGNALNALFAAQKGTASALNNVAQAQAAGHSAGHETVAQTAAATLPGRAMDAQAQLANKIANQVGVIEQKRPGLTADTLDKLRQQGFTDYATAQGLGLKQSALESQNAYRQGQLHNAQVRNRDSLVLGRQRNSITQQDAIGNLQERRRHDLAMETLRQQAAQKGVNGLTPAQQRTLHAANAKWRADAQGAAQQVSYFLSGQKDPKTGKAYSPAQVRSYLASKLHDGDMVDVAFALAQNKGKIPSALAQRLQARHIGVPQSWIQVQFPNPAQAVGAPPLGALPPGR